MEGSCNAMCEALALDVPVVASHISGLIGTLGEDYPGYFPIEDTQALAEQLRRAESDRAFYAELQARGKEAAKLLEPKRERQAWADLIAELV
jgi:glycosyltransferase involved in cell wall biosynthesis